MRRVVYLVKYICKIMIHLLVNESETSLSIKHQLTTHLNQLDLEDYSRSFNM